MSITQKVRNRNFMNMLTAVSPAWGEPFELDFAATNLIVKNKSNETIEFGYDADSIEGELDAAEVVTFSQMADGIRTIYARSVTGGKKVQVYAWQRGAIG